MNGMERMEQIEEMELQKEKRQQLLSSLRRPL